MDSAQKIANCIKASARDLGITEPEDERAKSIIGLGLTEAMQRLFPDLDATGHARLVEAYRYHFVTADETYQGLFHGVEQGLQALNDAGALLAVATGKARVGLQRVFGETDLERHFVATRCADETRSKPHPQMLLELLDLTAIDPTQSLMIGDTTYDMEMASNANVDGLGVTYGVHDEGALRAAKAVDVLDSFSGVIEWLLQDRIRPYG